MQKNLGGLGVLLVLGLGLGMLRSGSAPSSSARPAASSRLAVPAGSTAAAETPKKGKIDSPEKDLLGAIEAFLPQEPESVEIVCKNQKPVDEEFCKLAKSADQISFAIATVPDPVHTHLSLFFDRAMEAIQQGAQQAGWIFDRATMPWDSQEHQESTDFRIRLGQQDYQDNKESLPGLMIFRQADPKDLKTFLFILVVGETPTGGVNKEQFNEAATWIGTAAKSDEPLRIIGPTFSGSLYSLAQLFGHELQAGRFKRMVIRSGTVSSWNTMDWFKKQFTNAQQVDFATFQQSDSYMLRKFVEFEKCRGYAPDRIAVLAEDETAYGNLEFPNGGAIAKGWNSPCLTGARARDPAEIETILEQDESSVLRLYFPRDISQLRSAYQQGLGSQTASAADSYQVRSTLPLNLQDSGDDDDSVQQYAHSQTPLSQESILLGIIAAIREHHIQFVVVQATNPMDTVFLSGFLKKGYSAARVVAMPADLLLSRDADDVSLLHGVMALTTYSLLPSLKDEVAIASPALDSRVSHIFSSAYAVGIFNATLSQIICIDLPSASGCDAESSSTSLPVAHYAEYGWPSLGGKNPSESLAPVVWLTVLGRDGFWPLAILEDGGYTAGNTKSSPRPIARIASSGSGTQTRYVEFQQPWPLFWKMVCGLVLMFAALFWLLLRKGSVMASSSAMTLLAPIKDPCRSTLIVAIGWLLLAAMLLLIWPCVAWATLGLLPKLCVMAAAFVVLVHCGICVTELNGRGPKSDSRTFMIGAAILISCFVLLYVVPGHTQNPFLYRYIHLTSGVSPLLPLLCLLLGGLWWAWFSLSGLSLLDQRRPQLPRDIDLPASVPRGHTGAAVMQPMWPSEASARMLARIARPCTRSHRVYGPTLALFAVALFGLDYGHPLLSLEARHFEWAYGIALGAVALAAFGALFRLLTIWLDCGRILTSLDHFPLRRAFAELNFSWEPFWRLGGARWQDLYRLVSRQLETLEQLKREVEPEAGTEDVDELLGRIHETSAAQDEMRDKLARAFKGEESDEWRVPDDRIPDDRIQSEENLLTQPASASSKLAREREFQWFCIGHYEQLQERIGQTCAAALKYLQPRWWDEEGLIATEITSAEGEKKEDDDIPGISLATRLAERFVALVYLNFILSVILRMRTLAITVGGLYVFLLLSVNSYPFEPKVALRSAAILMLVFIVGMVGYVSAQVHRNSILSLVTKTKPGELGIAFWVRMGSFVALPLISLLVSQFPTLNNALFSWLEPAVSALK